MLTNTVASLIATLIIFYFNLAIVPAAIAWAGVILICHLVVIAKYTVQKRTWVFQ